MWYSVKTGYGSPDAGTTMANTVRTSPLSVAVTRSNVSAGNDRRASIAVAAAAGASAFVLGAAAAGMGEVAAAAPPAVLAAVDGAGAARLASSLDDFRDSDKRYVRWRGVQ